MPPKKPAKKEEIYTTTRIYTKSLKPLRMIYALTGEPIVKIIDRLAIQELKRVKKMEGE